MKKLTAGIFTVLMGLVSVNAADAAVASQGYVDFKVKANADAIALKADASTVSDLDAAYKAADTSLQQKIDEKVDQTAYNAKIQSLESVDQGFDARLETVEKLSGDGESAAATKTELNTVKDSIGTVETGKTVVGMIGENTTAISELSGTVQANKTAADAVAGRVATLEGAGYQNATQVGDAIDDKIEALNLANTYDAKGAASTAESNAKEYADGLNTAMDTRVDALEGAGYQNATQVGDAINTKITDLNLGDTYQTKANLSTEIPETNASAEKYTSESAVADYVDVKMGALSDSVGQVNTSITTLKGRVDTIEDEENGILAQAKTYALGKANAALTASVKYTDDYITALGLQDISRVPAACSDTNAYCTLTTNGSGFAWEVITRADGETPVPAAANVSGVTKPQAPAALTE